MPKGPALAPICGFRRVPRPALVLWGEADGIVSTDYGRAYADLFPDGRFDTIAGAAHYPTREQPAATAARIAAFVEVGTRVAKGQVVCIIEAMKVMNEIEAEVDGEVVEILVTDGQPVEYGETIFRLRAT